MVTSADLVKAFHKLYPAIRDGDIDVYGNTLKTEELGVCQKTMRLTDRMATGGGTMPGADDTAFHTHQNLARLADKGIVERITGSSFEPGDTALLADQRGTELLLLERPNSQGALSVYNNGRRI